MKYTHLAVANSDKNQAKMLPIKLISIVLFFLVVCSGCCKSLFFEEIYSVGNVLLCKLCLFSVKLRAEAELKQQKQQQTITLLFRLRKNFSASHKKHRQKLFQVLISAWGGGQIYLIAKHFHFQLGCVLSVFCRFAATVVLSFTADKLSSTPRTSLPTS